MQPGMGLHRYTGTAPLMPFGPWRGMTQPGHCRRCGQPSASCCCGCHECRKEAKELTVAPGTTSDRSTNAEAAGGAIGMLKALDIGAAQAVDVGRNAGYWHVLHWRRMLCDVGCGIRGDCGDGSIRGRGDCEGQRGHLVGLGQVGAGRHDLSRT